MKFINKKILILASCLVFSVCNSQELEPRAINNLPLGTNFLVGVYAYSQGDILLDPGLSINDLNSKIHGTAIAYLRSFSFFGMSAKADIVVPYVAGDWDGYLDENYLRIARDGFGDVRLRFSFNYLDSPALNIKEFKGYKPDLISGLSFQAILPTGDYDASKLVNLGSNRWAFKTQWGLAKNLNKWVVEMYASVWVFTKNNDFLDGNELTQNPLFTIKTHLVRRLPKGMWISANLGYAIGGISYMNGEQRNTQISTSRLGLFYAIPMNKRNTLKLGYISGIRFKQGSDFDAISVTYQYGWNNKK